MFKKNFQQIIFEVLTAIKIKSFKQKSTNTLSYD